MHSGDTYNEIYEYLKGTLTSEACTAFEKKLEVDLDLRKELAKQQFMNKMLLENKLAHVKELSKNLHTQELAEKSTRKYVIGAGAVALLSILGLLGYFYVSQTKPTEKESANVQKSILNSEIVDTLKSSDKTVVISKPIDFSTKESPKNTVERTVTRENVVSSETFKNNQHPQNVSDTVKLMAKNYENKMQQIQSIHPILIPCSQVDLKAQKQITNTCFNKNQGHIELNSISGGNAPYNYVIQNQDHQVMKSAHNLAAGTYLIIIKDHNSCEKIEEVIVKGKRCSEHYYINVALGQELNLGATDEDAIFIVKDANHGIYYQTSILAKTDFQWNGQSTNGNIKEGVYTYILEYKNESVQGTITISE